MGLLKSCNWLPESESKAGDGTMTVDKDSLAKDLLLALELHVLFSGRAAEEEQTTVAEDALAEAFKFSEELLSGKFIIDEWVLFLSLSWLFFIGWPWWLYLLFLNVDDFVSITFFK